MNKLKLFLLVASTFVGSRAFAQTYVPPPPSYPSTGGTVTVAPPRPPVYVAPLQEIRFHNGARVDIFREKVVLIEPNGQRQAKWRPLPDRARNPNGCGWLWNYLNTSSPYTRDWGDACLTYLEWCRHVR